MTVGIFVDTNVFVYARDAGEPVKQMRAATWLARLWREKLGRTSVQVLSEYYVTVTRKLDPGLPPADAWGDVTSLFAWHPASVDTALLTRGREIAGRYKLAWWDSLVIAGAEAQGCDLLLSEDFQDGGTYGSVIVRSPFSLDVNEDLAPYLAAPTTASRHRPRGRPKRSS